MHLGGGPDVLSGEVVLRQVNVAAVEANPDTPRAGTRREY